VTVTTFNRARFDGEELNYLAQAVMNGHVSGNGPFTRRAETLLETMHGGGRTLLATSCTHALEIAARLLEFEPGDEVIVPSFTFVSTASAFMLHGGTPVFADVDEATLNVTKETVEAAVTPRTRAICAVHYAGVGAEPDGLRAVADEYGLVFIEDNAHGLGGRWNSRPLGTFGQLSTLSFHETKNVTCGEGGALHINDPRYIERAEILREKGTNRSRFMRGQVDKYTWVDLGSSWVMSDLLAGVLCGQLERFGEIHAGRHQIWDRYHTELADWAATHGVRTPAVPEQADHTAHMYHLRFDTLATRTRFIEHLRECEIAAVFHYQPLHLSNIGVRLGGRPGDCPVSENAADTLVRLPLHLDLKPTVVDHVIDAVTEFRL
jgi:dTDP-4-amino-4,6-dideoxygalactose transaminase